MGAEPPEKPKPTVVVVYGPQFAEGTRRAGAVLRRLIARAAEQHGYGAPPPPARPAPPKKDADAR